MCVLTVCDKQGSVSRHRSLLVTNYVDTDPCLSQTVWTQIPVCHKLCGHRPLFVINCAHRSQTGICFHTVCDKQGSVFTQFVTNRNLCPHNLWQAGICFHTGCDKQGSVCTVWKQIPVCHKLCGNRSLFVTKCVGTDPCLSQPVRKQIPVCHKLCVWTQIPVCHKLYGHRSLFVINCVDTDPCLSKIVWTQIPVCHNDKQGSVSTQFVANRDLFPQIPVCYKLCGHRSLFVTACEDTNPCLSQPVCSLWQTGICVHTVCDKQGSVST
jgi:hypothetical protein